MFRERIFVKPDSALQPLLWYFPVHLFSFNAKYTLYIFFNNVKVTPKASEYAGLVINGQGFRALVLDRWI